MTMLRHDTVKVLSFIFAVFLASSSASADVRGIGEEHYLMAMCSMVGEKTNIQAATDITGIKDELTEQRLKCILAEVVKIKGGKIGKIIEKLEGHSTNWLWVIRDGSLPENVNAQTKLTPTGALSILDYRELEHATNLSIARTIIHEMIHAYLSLYFRYEQIMAIRDYPAIYSGWQMKRFADYNQLQHDEMERTFLNDIAAALKEYGIKSNVYTNDIIYNDLAWGGLNVQNSPLLTAKDKKRIQSRLLAEQSDHWTGTEIPVGTMMTKIKIDFCRMVGLEHSD